MTLAMPNLQPQTRRSLRQALFEDMRTPPLPFQVEGVRFIQRNHGRCLVGSDMGTGKTYQVVAYLKLNSLIRPAVVVCPASLKYNWQREFMMHAGLDATVVDGTKVYPAPGDIWIINYDILKYWWSWFAKQRPRSLVLDECKRLKDQKTQRSKAAKALAECSKRVMGLDGTPIVNRPVEFFTILNMIAPKRFPSFFQFAFRFCSPKRGWMGKGWDFSGASNLVELHEKVKPIMIRHLKADVLTQLPKKTRTVIPISLDNIPIYRRAEANLIEWLAHSKGVERARKAANAEALVKLAELKRLAGEGKFAALTDWVENWLEETGQKIVLFGVHRAMTGRLHGHFRGSVLINGETPLKERQAAVDRFQADPACRVFVGNIKAAGEGITLTAASTVVFTELGWTPGEHEQAEDRVLRIGQTSDRVDAYYFIGKDTIEEKIMEVIEAKRKVINQVLDGDAEAGAVATRVLEGLLQRKASK